MVCAWNGTVEKAKLLLANGTFVDEIISGYESSYQKATATEIRSWSQSLPELFDCLSANEFNRLQVIIELQMPVGAERADVVLLGGTQENPIGLIIELKQWQNIQYLQKTNEYFVSGIGNQIHPSLQVLNYRGKLKFFNKVAHQYKLLACVFMHNITENDLSLLTNSKLDSSLFEEALIFSKSMIENFIRLIKNNLLPINILNDACEKFSESPYEQSIQLFDFIKQNADTISKNSALSLANTGMGLTEEQELLKDEIIEAVKSNKKNDFIIQGKPGSGKTLLAISLLLKAYSNNMSVIFSIRNNRLMKILKDIFDQIRPGLSGMLLYFKPMMGNGLNKFQGYTDLLICDEAQRIDKDTLLLAPKKACTSAIFLDETQRLNPPEKGTRSNFESASTVCQKIPIQRQLSSSMRFSGGDYYSFWVESLLAEPNDEKLKYSSQKWSENYIFEHVESIELLISRLRQYSLPGNRVAMVASFTESPGNQNTNSPDNLRIGFPLTSGFDLYKTSSLRIPWLMKTEEYSRYWIKGKSNQLDSIASIYGCQGFESDYIGVVWGRDLIYRSGKWQLGDSRYCYDTIDGLINRNRTTWCEEAITLLINRYRIFLTRGIKGTLIFCEDKETRDYFRNLY